jgi:hypothetical protein
VSTRITVRLLVAATIAATMVPASAHALVPPSLVGIKLPPVIAPSECPKPPAVAHPDVAPPLPGGVEGSVQVTQAPLPVTPAPSPDGSGEGLTHAVDAGSSAGSDQQVRIFDGANRVTFGSFRDGDMIVVLDPSSLTGHAGLFDSRYYGGLTSMALWSSNVTPLNGVQREPCLKYRAYDRAFGLWVPSEYNHRTAVRDFAARQVGKPYSIFASKTDLRSFYCSKLAWTAWRYTSGADLDGDGGFWVWPVDLLTSTCTRIFGYWD